MIIWKLKREKTNREEGYAYIEKLAEDFTIVNVEDTGLELRIYTE